MEANLITHLEISGFINGTDLRLIREMAGIDYYGNPTLGQLRELDIAQATICSGGTNYSQYGSSVNIDNIIPGGCFSHTNLISIYLPFNTKKIEAQAFFFSEKLENISIPDDCRSIGWESFSACSLISVNIPRNVSFIDKLAFNRCYKLVSINVDSENRWYASIDGMLCDKKQETLIYYPAAGKKIINIPNTVKEINEYAFLQCTNLTKIYINREEPPFIEKRTFYRTNGELVIYVPKGCKERYKNSETWRTLNIIEME